MPFYGVGLGIGSAKHITLLGFEILTKSDVIIVPSEATKKEDSVAKNILLKLGFLEEKMKLFSFSLDDYERDNRYKNLAKIVESEVINGKIISYVTIGDPMTFSTYCYLVEKLKLKGIIPQKTIPGITSFLSLAGTKNFPLGLGKERILIVPSPNDMEKLRNDINENDVIVLMKVSKNFPKIVTLLREMNLSNSTLLGHRIGMDGGVTSFIDEENEISYDKKLGYFTTLIVRKNKRI